MGDILLKQSDVSTASEELPLSIVLSCIALVAILALLPSFVLGPPLGHSLLIDLVWLTCFDTAFWSGEFYPRWLSRAWGGVGSADFFFYAPLPFWVSSGLGGVICPTCDSGGLLNIGGVVLLAMSGLAFWVFARRFLGSRWALLAAVLYMLMPYHLSFNWYIRLAIGEFAAYAFAPFIGHFIWKLFEDKSGGLGLTLSIAGLALSHLPSLVICAVTFGSIAVWLAISRSTSIRAGVADIARVSAWAVAGMLLSAFYWLPALVLLSDVSAAELSLPDFLWSAWLFFDGNPEPGALRALKLKAVLLTATAFALYGAYLMEWQRLPSIGPVVLPVLVVWFFVTPLSWVAWSFVPGLSTIQFPWRFFQMLDLGAVLAIVVIAAHGARKVSRSSGKPAASAATTVRFAFIGIAVLQVPLLSDAVSSATWNSDRTNPNEIARLLDYRPTVWEYLPPPAHAAFLRLNGGDRAQKNRRIPARLDEVPLLQVSQGRARVSGEAMTSRRWLIDVAAEGSATITFKQAYWKYWQARDVIRGRPVHLWPEESVGLMQFRVPGGDNRIEIVLPRHWSENTGFWLSAMMGGVLIVVIVVEGVIKWQVRR